LIQQVRQSPKDRINALKEYVPELDLRIGYWNVQDKEFRWLKGRKEGGILEFGTSNADGSLAVLLGASPGASTAVSIMADLVDRCFGAISNSRVASKWR
jgi:malate dehydrogenase (quinone)